MWKSKVGFWPERSLTPCHGRSGRSVSWKMPSSALLIWASCLTSPPNHQPLSDRTRISSDEPALRSYDAQVRIQIKLALSDCTNRRSEEHTSELQSHLNLVCRLLLEKKNPRLPTV